MEPEAQKSFGVKQLIAPEYLPALEKFAQSNNRRMNEKLAVLDKHKNDTLGILEETSQQIHQRIGELKKQLLNVENRKIDVKQEFAKLEQELKRKHQQIEQEFKLRIVEDITSNEEVLKERLGLKKYPKG